MAGLVISLSVLSEPLIIQKKGKSITTEPSSRKMKAAVLRYGFVIFFSFSIFPDPPYSAALLLLILSWIKVKTMIMRNIRTPLAAAIVYLFAL